MATDVEERLLAVRNDRNLSCFDVTAIEDLSDDDIVLIFDIAREFKQAGNVKYSFLRGATIFNAFFENSTRTRASFELAGKKLGADTINIMGKGTSLGKGESLHDTAQTLDAMRADIIIVRTEHSGIPAFLAKHMQAALINAGDGTHQHPSQGLLDAFTMAEHYSGDVEGKTLLIVGDISHSRVFGSLARIAHRLKLQIRIAAPATFLRKGFNKAFPYVEIFHDVEAALQGVDIINALRVQEERGGTAGLPTYREFSKAFGITEKRFAMANDGAILMHPGPVMRDIEIHNVLMTKGPTKILQQVENGLAIRTALEWLLAARTDGQKKSYTPV